MNSHKSILYVWLPCKRIYPVGPTYLASYVHHKRPGVRQHILDLSLVARRKRLSTLITAIREFNPNIVAFSWRDIQIYAPHEEDDSLYLAFDFYYSSNPVIRLNAALKGLKMVLTYTSNIREKVRLVRQCMKTFPDKKYLIGGGALSVFSDEIMQVLPEGITGVIGEGEEAILALIDDTDIQKHRVIVKKNGSLLHGHQEVPVQIEKLHIDYSYISTIFPQVSSYFGEIIGIQTKRGCPYKCEFCLYPFIEGEGVRYRDPEIILDEVEYLYRHWNVRKIWFADAQFIPGKNSLPYCRKLLNGLVEKGLSLEWSSYIRTSLITLELAELMVASGVGDLEVSITSGSQRILNEMTMGFKLEHLYEGCKALKKAGYSGRIFLNYSINAPGETRETLLETIQSYRTIVNIIGKRAQVKPVIFFIGVQPHTRLERRLIENGYLSSSYDPLSLNPFSIKKLLYNPPPLDKVIARSCIEAWKSEEGSDGFMKILEKRLLRS